MSPRSLLVRLYLIDTIELTWELLSKIDPDVIENWDMQRVTGSQAVRVDDRMGT